MSIGRAALGRPVRQANRTVRIPAPIGGVDARIALGAGNLRDCVYTYNLMPFEQGMTVRKGFKEWQIGVETTSALGVTTMIPYDGLDTQGSGDKLFAVTNEGIWDVSISGAAPILKFTFTDQTSAAGYGPFTHYITDAGDDLLFYADSANGLFTYTASTNTWAATTGITGVTPADVRFIVSHKQRLWMIEKDSTDAWYLPIGSIAGAATVFHFGSKFKHGGSLKGLFNWSVDGGDGVDDYLVAVSRGGDVIPYQGEDPSSANTWSMVGTYFIGEIPEGTSFGSEQGGELYLLSSYGLIGMGDLLKGVDTAALAAGRADSGMTAKISFLLRQQMADTLEDAGWSVQTIPSEGGILINSPVTDSGTFIQYYYNIDTRGWGLWRGVPMLSMASWNGDVYFGTEDNRVMAMTVTVDEVLLTPPAEGLNGRDIEFSILTNFSDFELAGLHKKVALIRPDFVASLAPVYSATARYDFNTVEAALDANASVVAAGDGGGAWDVGLWDVALWGGDEFYAFTYVGGSWGLGRYVAIATKGETRVNTRLIGWDVTFTTGGALL